MPSCLVLSKRAKIGDFEYDGTKTMSNKVFYKENKILWLAVHFQYTLVQSLIGLLSVWSGSCKILIGDKYTCMF